MIPGQRQVRKMKRVEIVRSPVVDKIAGDEGWLLPGARKDVQSITADWVPLSQPLIEGVRCKEVRNVAKESGYLTELYRADWALDDLPVAQVFQGALLPGAISAWHVHAVTTDRLCCNDGLVKIVLYDARCDSPTFGLINEFRLGAIRPGLVVVPPRVWHGVKNIGQDRALLINLVDQAYCYENPDSWRLAHDSELIPYSFARGGGDAADHREVPAPHFVPRLLLGDD